MQTTQVSPGTINRDAEPIFKPIFGKVVIKIDSDPDRMYGKLYLPQRERTRTSIGKVISVYESTVMDGEEIVPQVKLGDTVIFGQFTGTSIEIGNEVYIICREQDLLTIVEFPGERPIVEEAFIDG